MIQVIPLISIAGGKVVRTFKGDIDQVKVYDLDPIELAMEFEANGLTRVHLVDLDGAKQRKIVNYHIIDQIAKYTKLKIDFTGGLARDPDVRTAFECGATTVTVATVAVHEKEKFYSWYISYGGEKIILAADSLNGIVLTKGWQQKDENLTLFDHLDYYYNKGVQYVKCTEIGRDGTLTGPAFDLYKDIRAKFPDLKILASGGIRSVDDIEELDKLGVYAVIFGKSYYEGKVKLADLQKFLVNTPA